MAAGSKRRSSTAGPSSRPAKRVRQPPRPKPYDNTLQALEQSQSQSRSKPSKSRKGKGRALTPVPENEEDDDEEARLHDDALNQSMGAGGGAEDEDADNDEEQEVEEAEDDADNTAETEVFSFGVAFRVVFGKQMLAVKSWPVVKSDSTDYLVVDNWSEFLSRWFKSIDNSGRLSEDIYKVINMRITASYERSGLRSLVNEMSNDVPEAEGDVRRAKQQLKMWYEMSKQGLNIDIVATVIERTAAPARTPGSQRRAAQRTATDQQLAQIRSGTYGTQRGAEDVDDDDGLFVRQESPLRRTGIEVDEDGRIVPQVTGSDDFLNSLNKQWRCGNKYCKNYGNTCWWTGPDNPQDHCKMYPEITRRWWKAARAYELDKSKPHCTLMDPGSTLTAKLWKEKERNKTNPYAATTSKQGVVGATVIKQYFGSRNHQSSSPRGRSPSRSPPVLFSSQPATEEPSVTVRTCFDWLVRSSTYWLNRQTDLDSIYDLLVNEKDFDLQQIYNIKQAVWVDTYSLKEGQYSKLRQGIQKYRHSSAYRQNDRSE